MRKTMTLAIAAVALTATGTAFAQIPAGAQRDAAMTREMAQQRAAAAFERLDINHDGMLDQADRDSRVRARFDAVDADKDGAVSYEEFTARREDRKERLAERREMRREAMAARGEQPQGQRMAMRGMRPMRAMAEMGPAARMVRAAAGANADGAITRDEFVAAALTRFDAADSDDDGSITRDERRNTMRQRRGDRS